MNKIINRYIIKELTIPFASSLFILIFVLLSNFILKNMDKFLGKGLSFGTVLKFLIYNSAWIVSLAIPMSILIATLMAFGRLSSDNEITAFKASGISMNKLILPAMIFGLIVFSLITPFNLWILPEMNHKARLLSRDISRKRPDLEFEAGYFINSIPEYTFFLESRLNDVFKGITIYSKKTSNKIQQTITATSGTIENTGSGIILHLSNGEIHELNNNTDEYFKYSWNLADLNIGPGDEIIYWIKAYDNNSATGPGIGVSNTLRAYFPSLEELFLEVENEQENIFETFDNMNESMEELKNMYEDISNDVLKQEMGWEQEKNSDEMINEIENISSKIESLEKAIQKIEELNENNNLINENLGDKIETLQKMFQDIITPELMAALQELQKSLNEDDFKKSLEELNNFEFEMEDLENQLDRMIDLFEQVVAEQKLNELIKKIENMVNLQKEISNDIKNKAKDSSIKPMEEKQSRNLDDLFKTMENAEQLLKKNNKKTADNLNELRNSSIAHNLQKEINNISNNSGPNKKESSDKIENHINEMENKLNEIISEYNKKMSIEILTMYTRIIKNLLDMSYEQELINKESKNIKYKTNSNIKNITSKENIILYQYKNLFIQISDLSRKSFHIKPEVSKTFGQIFNNLIKTINNFEQGKIPLAKEQQGLILEYINKAALLLLKAMDEMQASNSMSGYAEYLKSIQELSQGQQLMNQGMQSLLPIPFGQQPGQNALMQSLINQQQKLMEQLKQLMKEGGNPGGGKEGKGELGKALEEMEEIIKNLQNNIMNEETFDKGEKVYNKLLNHKKAIKEKGMDQLWKTEKFNENELTKNNKTINLKNDKNLEIQELYETLNSLNKNKNITKENKSIIEEYIRILINEQINEQNNAK